MTPRERAEQRLRLLQEKRARQARSSLAAYIQLVWPLIDSATYLHNWHVDAICEHLEAVTRGEIQYLWINIPPGMLKSLAVSVFWPAWEWLQAPHLQYQRASYSAALATRDNVKIRDLIRHPRHVALFGEIKLKDDQDNKTYYETLERGSQRVVSPKASTTGWRSHRLIVDDLLDAAARHSDAEREFANEWFSKSFLSRRHDESRDPVVVVAQRLHEADVYGHIESKLSHLDFVKLILPQRFDGARRCTTRIGWSDPRTEHGELLFPARVSAEQDAANQRTLGEADYAAQHTQLPTPAGGAIFKTARIQYYQLHPAELCATAGDQARLILSLDCAFKDHSEADFVCVQVILQWKQGFALLDEVMSRLDLTATIHAARGLFYKWNAVRMVEAILVEDTANGPSVIKSLKEELSGVLAITPQGGKIARAHAMAPVVDAAQFWLPDPSLGVEFADPTRAGAWLTSHDKAERYGKFPRLANDDDIDATTQGINWLRAQAAYWATF